MSRQKAKIETPLSRDDPAALGVEEIPLPPEAMWSELDNSQEAPAEAGNAPAETTETPERVEREIAALDFEGEVFREIPLAYPFRLDGKKIASVTVRRLTVGAVGDIIDRRSGREVDNFDIYAEMTGLPAAVLRGLVFDDGDVVTGACHDFLPRVFRPRQAQPEDASS